MSRPFGFKNKQIPFEEPVINLTALIDVVFVILIMFILIAPLLELDNIQLADAPAIHSRDTAISMQETSPLSIQVQKDNTVFVNKEIVPLPRLIERLKRAKAQYPKVRPQLFHDRKAEFGTYQSVKNALEEAGFQEVDIVLKPS